MTAINLIPPDVCARRDVRRLRHWIVRLASSTVVVVLLYAGLVHMVALRNAELHRLTGRFAFLQEHIQSAERVLDERDALKQQYTAIALIRGHCTAGRYMELLGDALPPEGYLRALEIGSPSKATSGQEGDAGIDEGPTELHIWGRAPAHQQVGHLMRQMTTSRDFGTVNLVSVSDLADPERGQEVEFEILCTPGGVAQ